MIYHSNPPFGDIEQGLYVDAKKRKWHCSLSIGRFNAIEKATNGGYDGEVIMKTDEVEKRVSVAQFREFVFKKSIIKI